MSLFKRLSIVLLTAVTACFSTGAWAQGMTFGLAGKSLSDGVFIAAWQACDEEAKKAGDRCIHIGFPGPAQFRVQDRAILQALDQPLNGVAVSVTNSEWLAQSSLKKAEAKNVPVITFDSDLEPSLRRFRRAYVGPDNLRFGEELGRAAAKLHPGGGTLCLMSADVHDPNLNDRLQGVRQAMGAALQSGRLQGQNGWREVSRCPWFNGDDPQRALIQMETALRSQRIDAFVSVGDWPLRDVARYRQVVAPFVRARNGVMVVVGTGAVTPEQVKLLQEGLVGAFVSLDFEEMGRTAYREMKKLATGGSVEPVTHTGVRSYVGPSATRR